MAEWRRFFFRLLAFFRADRADRDLDREVASHLALLEEEYRRRGMTIEQARVAARHALGGVDRTKAIQRDERSFPWLEDLRRDVPYAVRALARQPGFAAAAVLTLALGIGATTAIFSVVNAVLLRPLPYRDGDRLVRIAEHVSVSSPGGARATLRFEMTQDEFLDWRARTTTLTQMAAVRGNPATTFTAPDGPVRVATARVSPAIFELLGAEPRLGRFFTADDERPDADGVIVSAAAWQRYFAGDPQVLGRRVVLNNAAFSVIGVAPAGFDYPSRDIQFWTPLAPRAGQGRSGFGQVIARLADGVSMDVATQEANAIGRAVRPDGPSSGFGAGPPPAPRGATTGGTGQPEVTLTGQRFQVIGVKELIVAPVRPAMRLLAASVCVVLLIVCANVANLLLARGTARQREIGIRLALGAGRGRIVRQVMTECGVLAGAGGIGGAALAVLGVRLVKTLSTVNTPFFYQISANLTDGSVLPRLGELHVDTAMLAFACGTSILAGLLFGLGPAVALAASAGREARTIGMGAASRSTGSQPPRTHIRHALVVSQLVMATTLLVGAGLLLHSFVKLSTVDTGYNSSRVLTFQLTFRESTSTAERLSLIEGLLARLASLPQVEGAGFTNIAPFLALTEYRGLFVPPGKSRDEMLQDPLRPQTRSVSAGFLPALGARLVEGRWLNEGDAAGQPNVMLVNRALAQRYFGGASPVGTLVRTYRTQDAAETWEIVGVVEDVRQARLDQDVFPIVYLDTRQMLGTREAQAGNPFGFPSIAVRVAGEPASIVPDARAILRELDPGVGLDSIATLDDLKYGSLVRPRFYSVLLGLFAAIAGLLAAIGIYGVLAYSVVQRTQEIGIRMALGAQRRDVLRGIVRQGMTLAAIGIGAGILGAVALTRYLTGMLYGLTPLDAPTFAAVALAFAAVALLASYVPARRATRVDPVVALRCE